MADPKVNIVVEAEDKASKVLKSITDGFKDVQKGIDQLDSTIKESTKVTQKQTLSWTDFRSMYQTVLDVVRVGQKVWAATVGELIAYGDQVQKLKTITGQSAEETSRQIQLADDLRVSYESLTVALKFASNKGIDTSIDGLAKLADQYKKLAPGIDRTQFLIEKFGKSGIEMAKILEKDSAALREMAAATKDGLIVNDQDLAKIKKLNQDIDALTDSWSAFKMAAAKNSLPLITAALGEMNRNIEKSGLLLGVFRFGWDDVFRAIKSGSVHIDGVATSIKDVSGAASETAESLAEMEAAQLANEQAAQALSSSLQGLVGLTMSLQTENDNYAEKLADLQQEYISLVAKQGEFMKGSEQWDEYQTKIDETKQKFFDLAEAHEEASRRIAFGLLQQKLAADGFTQAEFDGLIKIGVQWGILDQQTADAAVSMDQEMQNIADNLNGVEYYGNGATKSVEKFDAATQKMANSSLPDANQQLSSIVDQLFVAKANQGTYYYKYIITGSGSFPTPPGNAQAAASGGTKTQGGTRYGKAEGTKGWETVPAGFPNDSYPIGLTSGERFAVIPNNSATPTGGAGAGMINVSVNLSSFISLADQRDAEYKLKPIIERAVRSAQGVI